ncbi:nitronate monooxygenase [Frigidibacter albus]|uniref:Nitronate monooxygenase n=1 Tax=Frigidibacter albus TaxID=1465486 RepID=A0A6L8VMR7_9RHOB|nr:nitronate monooxygenase family protein [Frigidibacter albus]MZQ91091.1 nitronate monooxygenase [Frigidibacter albus]NBE32976.1 nitronate monooxygenase [Frigidibacter albus]GGH62744.1 2-nitropropane dioxygenase [Frigidibacter albus]
MPVPAALTGLRAPIVAAPMFLTSGPDLVIETCRSGLLGTFPALNQRTTQGFADWLARIEGALSGQPGAAPYGVNMIVHKSNPRLQADMEVAVAHKVPVIITSLGAVPEVVEAVHSYGGLVFHDVINARHARKAAEAGVDGIVCVSAGAGGHGGTLSPFAILPEIRSFFSGTLLLSGTISTGAQVAAARMMGADLAYMGTRFLATREAMVTQEQKDMTVGAGASDILYTPAISGVAANFLRPSIAAAGLDPDNLVAHGALDMENEAKAWKTVWSAGQGVAAIDDCPPAAELADRLVREYRAAMFGAAQDIFLAAETAR